MAFFVSLLTAFFICSHAVTLEWESAAGTNTVGYRLYVIHESESLPTVDIGLTNRYDLPGLDPLSRYLIFLTARDAAGFESDASDVLQYPESAPCLVHLTLGETALPGDRTEGFFIVVSSSACYANPSSDSSWLTFGDPVPIGGRVLVSFSAQSNRSEDSRSALISVGQTRFTILQRAGKPIPPLVIRSLSPFPIAADEGTRFDLIVGVEPEASLRFQWFKDNEPIVNATNALLSIAEVSREDAGKYSVSIANDVGVIEQGPVTVSVNELPRIVRNPDDLLLTLGGFGLFSILTTGKDLHYFWTGNGQLLTNDTQFLIVGPVRPENVGLYQVTVSNQVGVAQSQPFYLTTREREQQFGRMHISLRSDHTLFAQGEGVPGDSYDIQVSRDLSEWSTIDSVIVSDVGIFTIEAPQPLDDSYGSWFVRTLHHLPSQE